MEAGACYMVVSGDSCDAGDTSAPAGMLTVTRVWRVCMAAMSAPRVAMCCVLRRESKALPNPANQGLCCLAPCFEIEGREQAGAAKKKAAVGGGLVWL